jgi:transcriptional regulator with XRE-family HTH domain
MNNDDSNLVKIGKSIKKQRMLQRMSQEELAHRASVGLSYYGRLERGQQNMSVECLIRISLALQIEPCELIPKLQDLIYE